MAIFLSKALQKKLRICKGNWFSRVILPPYLSAYLDLCSFENTSRFQACVTAALFSYLNICNREKDEPAERDTLETTDAWDIPNILSQTTSPLVY